MSLFDTIKRVTSVLQPARTIQTSKTIDTGDVEQSAGMAIQANNAEAQAAQAQAQSTGVLASALTGVAKSAEAVKNDYDRNLAYSIMHQQENIHRNTDLAINSHNDPNVISQAAASGSASLLALNKSADGLPTNMRNNIIDGNKYYSQSLLQKAAIKGGKLNATNTLNTVTNGMSSQFKLWETQLNNETDPKKRQKIFDNISEQAKDLESIEPNLTTQSQVTHLHGLINKITSWAFIHQQPQPKFATTGLSDALLDQSNNTIKRGEAVTNGINDVLHGGKIRDTSEIDASSNPDYVNLYNAKVRAKQLSTYIANSGSITQDIASMKASGNYVAGQVAKTYGNYIKNGQSDILASILSPDVKYAHQTFIEDANNPKVSQDQLLAHKKDYYTKLKTWLTNKGLDDKSMDSLTPDQKNYMEGFASSDPENLEHTNTAVNSLYQLTGNKNATIFGGDANANALRMLRFSEAKDGNLSFPESDATIVKSYYPSVQKAMKSDSLLFKEGDFKDVTFKSASGNDSHISNSSDLGTYVVQNASSFNISKLSTLTGNDSASLMKSVQTQIYLKVKAGESPENAITEVKAENEQKLIDHPIYSGSISGGSRYSLNPDVAHNYGLTGVAADDYPAIMSTVSEEMYKNLSNRSNLRATVIGEGSASEDTKQKYNNEQIETRNKQYLGDPDNSYIYSSNGRIYYRSGNGHKFLITTGMTANAANDADQLKYKSKKLAEQSMYGNLGQLTL